MEYSALTGDKLSTVASPSHSFSWAKDEHTSGILATHSAFGLEAQRRRGETAFVVAVQPGLGPAGNSFCALVLSLFHEVNQAPRELTPTLSQLLSIGSTRAKRTHDCKMQHFNSYLI